jgi:hypothetical protein
VVSTNVGPVDEGHAQRDTTLPNQLEQAPRDALFGPADEQLRGQPPQVEFGRHAAPLGAALMPPENGRDLPP